MFYDDSIKNECIRILHELWGSKAYKDRNPAPQPKSLRRDDFRTLKDESFVVSEKVDGERRTMMLCTCNGRDCSIFVDRKLGIQPISVAASRSYFKGSIFDGELVKTHDGREIYIVFDCVAIKGDNSIKDRAYTNQIKAIQEIFNVDDCVYTTEDAVRVTKTGKIISGGNRYALSFASKAWYSTDLIQTLVRKMQSLPYQTDGFIFAPVDRPVGWNVLKFKTTHTVDVEEYRDGGLYLGVGGGPTTATQRLRLDEVLPGLTVLDAPPWDTERGASRVLELTVLGDRLLRYTKTRLDKTHPNTSTVFLKTLENFSEDIAVEELLELFMGSARP